MTPRVSVLMPVAEGTFLAPAMDTILAQEFRDIEVVVVDDASDADTQAALAGYAAADGRVRVVRREEREGLPVALNAGLAECRAPLVARADADDVYDPARLGRQVAAFQGRPDLALVSCGWRRVDAAGRQIYVNRPPVGSEVLRFHLLFGNPLLHPGAMLRAEAVRSVGGYDPAFWTAQDTDLWVRLAARFEVDNLPEPLVDWRQHGTSISAARGEAGRALSLTIRVRQQASYLGTAPPDDVVRATSATFVGAEPIPFADLATGERQMVRFLDLARAREAPAVVAHLLSTMSTALLRQSRWALRAGHPVEAARLAARSLRWRRDQGIETAAPLIAATDRAAA
ncbi:MAG: glycosyltransferase [Pseudomonadota bacterium]